MADVLIVGGGLAGSEAAWQLAERGVAVRLYEMRPTRSTPAHHSAQLAELVCSNSLKSLDPSTAAGTLKQELALLGSFLISCALAAKVQAGGALAVDREVFAAEVTARIEAHPHIELIREELGDLDDALKHRTPIIVATGPLTSSAFEACLTRLLGKQHLAFYDAAAPIVEAASLNHDLLFAQSRYDKGSADYLNAPLNRAQYEHFISELITARLTLKRSFETAELFQACQPIEEVARKGLDTLRHGALKPVGLYDPHTQLRPWAVVQLRAENRARSAYNLVGFQTNLSFGEQQRVFRLIPGLEQAEFSRFGVMHRNTFIDAPRLLAHDLSLKADSRLRFAGQITGTEGYCEAIGSGLYAALASYAALQGRPAPVLPPESTLGSLLSYATDPQVVEYQPMHVNYGIMLPLEPSVRKKRERYTAFSRRAVESMHRFRSQNGFLEFLPSYPLLP
ncbi:MAG: methylenetetrahydrofolate--tRNA-(uracil(54)-C(5))-methyltransferase (FADH(2)-oxidizing) TrmFO [Coriobacteriales bacterium]|jgi:methylenetetrahydrofolate--tRNA-(uracil-5-)-methyltransferase|nr:methylenetetrahydrofolate--tRNA-(uracil(54)-C(5))-methyltransferase (FADH(2)-oxidizing) TrmFO [Coriobacteriales bacterium]